jgi:hypothetical protein
VWGLLCKARIGKAPCDRLVDLAVGALTEVEPKKLSIQQRIGIRATVFFAGWIVPIRMASEPIGCAWGPALGLKRLRVRGFAERRPGLGFRR